MVAKTRIVLFVLLSAWAANVALAVEEAGETAASGEGLGTFMLLIGIVAVVAVAGVVARRSGNAS